MNTVVARMQADLLQARKQRDQLTVEALQGVLARITNAEAVVPAANLDGAVGVGATEAARRELSDADIQSLIQAEVAEIKEALRAMSAHPDHPYAVDLTQKLVILEHYTHQI